MSTHLKAAVHNLGCKVNACEAEAMSRLLADAGYELVPFEDYADIYVINTCSVTNIADRKSRQMLHRARKMNPDCVVIACGCYAQAAARDLLDSGEADMVIGNDRRGLIAVLLDDYLKARDEGESAGRAAEPVCAVADLSKKREYEELPYGRTGEYTRAFVKVQDGCDQFCSYCIIPYTRGRVRSRDMDKVCREASELARDGYTEVVLTGIHLSSYGRDFDERTYEGGPWLIELIRRVAAVPGIERVRLGSLEPNLITERTARELSQIKELCPHFHLSLQSGSDAVLKRMNRHYTAAEYLEKCDLLRRYFEHPSITTDVIVGFPGETEQEFQETAQLVKAAGFYELHVFKYSKREGTRAAEMPGQVDEAEKARRSHELIALGQSLSRLHAGYYIGRTVSVLTEECRVIEGRRFITGFTPEYIRAALPVSEDSCPEAGRLIRARGTALLEGNVLECAPDQDDSTL